MSTRTDDKTCKDTSTTRANSDHVNLPHVSRSSSSWPKRKQTPKQHGSILKPMKDWQCKNKH